MPKEKTTKKRVNFSFYAPEAKSVSLAGDFNNWDVNSTPLKKDAKGMWKKSLSLAPGRYEYKFFVDGDWKEDPKCSSSVSNIFGTQNSVLIL